MGEPRQPKNRERQLDAGQSLTSSSPMVPFKLQAKVEIPAFGEVDANKLNYWLKQLELYFQNQGFVDDI